MAIFAKRLHIQFVGVKEMNALQKTRPRDRIATIFAILSITALTASPVHGQASLAAEDIIDDIVVTEDGQSTAFTVLRDARRPEQWYYVPNQPHLAESRGPSGLEPEFTLLRYQARDPANPQKLLEGGLLQFAATMASPNAIDQIKSVLRQRGKGGTDLRVSALVMRSAEVHVYSPQSHDLIASGALGEGVAPVFASQKMVFEIPLTQIGADVYSSLVSGTTGVPLAMILTYEGLTPVAGVTVRVNWDQTYKHYSEDSKVRARASYFGLFGASYSRDAASIREDLLQNHCIEIQGITDSTFTAERLDNYLQPLLKQINDEITEGIKPPPKIDPATAANPTASGFFASAGYSVSMKSYSSVRHGSSTFDLHVQSIVERKTLAAGFIGVGKYSQDVRSRLMLTAPSAPWEAAYFVAPGIGDAPQLGIDEVSLNVTVKVNNTPRETQILRWTPATGWLDVAGQTRTALVFPLLGAATDPTHISIESTTQVTHGQEVLQIRRAIQPNTPIVTPTSLVDAVRINTDNLTFKRMSESSKLVDVQVSLREGDRNVRAALRARKSNGVWDTPEPFVWLVEHRDGGGPHVIPNITFDFDDGTSKSWKFNGRDLGSVGQGLDISLLDADWK
jgi:hypothetical protein